MARPPPVKGPLRRYAPLTDSSRPKNPASIEEDAPTGSDVPRSQTSCVAISSQDIQVSTLEAMSVNASFFQLRTEPLIVDWSAEGDRLLHLLFEELGAEVGDLQGHNMTTHMATEDEPFFYYDFGVTSETLRSRLCLLPTSAGAVLPVVRVDDHESEAQIEPWAVALTRAAARLGDDHPLHTWWAAIGATTDFNSQQALGGAAVVGGMSLAPGSRPYLEVVESFVPSMSGGQINHSYPVVVSGASRGYSFPVAQEDAADRLNRLCALLSIVWDGCWQLRQAPQPFPLDPAELPKSRLLDNMISPDGSLSRSEVEIPLWIEGGLAKLDEQPDLLQLARAHHQGLMLEERSPSYALLAYVAVIEGIGARYVDLTRCECCKSCSVKIGSGKRFRTALGLVLPEDEARRFGKAYGKRSLTAHQGQLHGGESLFGSTPGLRIFSQEESRLFRYQQVWPLRRASRELMTLALTDRLPTSLTLESPDDH